MLHFRNSISVDGTLPFESNQSKHCWGHLSFVIYTLDKIETRG